jgi:large subunit ribosomal protein L22
MKTEVKKGYSAKARYMLISPTKVRRVADKVRGLPYVEALAILDHLPHHAARVLRKVVQSAASNAMHQNNSLDEDMIYVKVLEVNEGPRMKRLWHRARGRADIIQKRMSHITVIVDELGNAGA